jgi:peptide/nickel transport system substrate-binding protein
MWHRRGRKNTRHMGRSEPGPHEAEQDSARRINKAALEYVVYAPLGFYFRYFAWRRNLTGVAQAPMPFFWDVTKTA